MFHTGFTLIAKWAIRTPLQANWQSTTNAASRFVRVCVVVIDIVLCAAKYANYSRHDNAEVRQQLANELQVTLRAFASKRPTCCPLHWSRAGAHLAKVSHGMRRSGRSISLKVYQYHEQHAKEVCFVWLVGCYARNMVMIFFDESVFYGWVRGKIGKLQIAITLICRIHHFITHMPFEIINPLYALIVENMFPSFFFTFSFLNFNCIRNVSELDIYRFKSHFVQLNGSWFPECVLPRLERYLWRN